MASNGELSHPSAGAHPDSIDGHAGGLHVGANRQTPPWDHLHRDEIELDVRGLRADELRAQLRLEEAGGASAKDVVARRQMDGLSGFRGGYLALVDVEHD